MTISTDNFGNTFAGNYLAGDNWNPSTLLTCIQTALGSNDRVNIKTTSLASSRYDWRPNIPEETLAGVIPTPAAAFVAKRTDETAPYRYLADNARFAFAISNFTSLNTGVLQVSPYMLFTDVVENFITNSEACFPAFNNTAVFHSVCTSSSISVFIKQGSVSCFVSQGVLVNSGLGFPNNIYAIAVKSGVSPSRIRSRVQNGATTFSIFASTAIANYEHNQKSDSQPTTNEIEFYLRRSPDEAQLGFVPNVFKVKIESPNTDPVIGDIVRLDLAKALSGSFYNEQGNIFCVVVGRLGNASETDLTGDYLFMRVAG